MVGRAATAGRVDRRMGWAGVRPPLVIEIPGTFDRRLSGNGVRKTHWGTRKTLNDELKLRVGWYAKEAVGNVNDPVACFQRNPWPLRIDYVIGWEKGARRMDDDNVLTAAKGMRDAVASILGIDDKNFVTGTVTQERDPAQGGYMRIRIASAEEAQAA